jgi:protease-4
MDENSASPPGAPPIQPPPPLQPPAAPPPPVTPPPRLIAPAASAPSRRGRGWMVFAIILLVLLALSGLYNVRNATNIMRGKGVRYSARTAGPRLEEVVVEDNDANTKIAVIEINGIITSRAIDQSGYNMVDVIKAQLKQAQEDDKVKAVILKVDSPGGEVLASDEINREIADFQNKGFKSKPVVASMGDLAASGGYYVSVPCQWIVANDLTITGSIGVILHSWNYRGLMDKVGVLPEVYKSGKFKDMLSGEREPNQILPEERQMVQSLIDETYGKFKGVVEHGREQAHKKNKDQGQALSPDWADYADGRVLSGTAAYKLGFVDQLGDYQDAVERAKTIAGITSANLVEYQQRYDISDFFRMFGQSGRAESRSIKVDLGMDLPKLQAGQLYFLPPTFLH